MSRSAWILAVVLCAALFAPTGTAGTAGDPELTDPEGDTAMTTTCDPPACLEPPYAPDETAAGHVDVLSAYVTEPAADRYTVVVTTAAAVDADTRTTVGFSIVQGPDSVFGSTADGQEFTATAAGASLDDGPNGTTVSQDGTTLTFTFTRAATGASGGDLLTDLTVDATRTQAGSGPLAAGSQTDTDGAPNANQTARAYAFDRPDVLPGAEVNVVNATIDETIPRELAEGATVLSGPDAANDTVARVREAAGDTVETYDASATVSFLLRLENTGSDRDTYTLGVFDPTVDEVGDTTVGDDDQSRSLDRDTVTLDPGNTTEVLLTVSLTDAPPGKYASVVRVTSERNATASVGVLVERLEVPLTPTGDGGGPAAEEDAPPVVDPGREPLSGLGWLTPAAEALGFDEAFGDYAELVLLALLLLLLLVVVFLVLFLVRGDWVAVKVTPSSMDAGPGETAEFHVEVRNRRRQFRGALARFEQEPGWKTGVLLRSEDGTAIEPLMDEGTDRELGLAGRRQSGDTLQGTLRVRVPDDVEPGERGHVTLSVVPVGDDGRERPRRGDSARVRVNTGAPAGAEGTRAARGVPVRLREVRHQPESPLAGDVVTTTATLANDSDSEAMRLRVVLQLDGEDADEEVVELPPRSARGVVFRWLADEGSNRVRVQVFEAQ